MPALTYLLKGGTQVAVGIAQLLEHHLIAGSFWGGAKGRTMWLPPEQLIAGGIGTGLGVRSDESTPVACENFG